MWIEIINIKVFLLVEKLLNPEYRMFFAVFSFTFSYESVSKVKNKKKKKRNFSHRKFRKHFIDTVVHINKAYLFVMIGSN